MRKLLVVVAFVALAGCQLPVPELLNDYTQIEASNPADVEYWITGHIYGKSDMEIWGQTEFWAWPQETFLAGAGDCDDKALLFADICINKLGISESSIQILIIDPYEYSANHAMVRIDGKDYMSIGITDYKVLVDYTWDMALRHAQAYH